MDASPCNRGGGRWFNWRGGGYGAGGKLRTVMRWATETPPHAQETRLQNQLSAGNAGGGNRHLKAKSNLYF
jgi:hypothetical protein